LSAIIYYGMAASTRSCGVFCHNQDLAAISPVNRPKDGFMTGRLQLDLLDNGNSNLIWNGTDVSSDYLRWLSFVRACFSDYVSIVPPEQWAEPTLV